MTFAAICVCVGLGGFAVLLTPHSGPTAVPAAPLTAASTAPALHRPADAAAPPDVSTSESQGSGAFASREVSGGAIAAYGQGDVTSAVERFTKAVEADPQNADALNNLGQVLVRTGRAREATAYLDRAVALDAGVWAYQFNRARAYGELQDWTQAIAGYRKAAELFPADYATQFNLARALQASGDVNAALAAFERAIQLAPGQADFNLAYGRALEAAGRPRDAATAYTRFLELEPSSSDAEKIKGRIAELEKS